MGAGRFSPDDWGTFTRSTTAGKSTADVFTSKKMEDALNPVTALLRESRDSDDNPNSTPLIVALDVTGSMGMIADYIARTGLSILFTEIYDRKPIPDPHIMFMGVGDVKSDRAPLQVSQFEADIRIADQLTKLWLEHGGGANSNESYTLPWHFAATRTSTDSMLKRKKKGYLFTIGDEEPPEIVTAADFAKVYGPGQWEDLTSRQLLDMVGRNYHVFHVIVEQGNHMHYHRDSVIRKWNELLGQRALLLSDYKNLAEVVVSAIQVTEGISIKDVTKSWSGDTSVTVAKALAGMDVVSSSSDGKGVVAF